MNFRNAHVLITGGSVGIGRGLAERFLREGSKVIVTGRNEEKLQQVAAELPGLETFVSDIGNEGDREALAEHMRKKVPGLNIVINNAGIQRRITLADEQAPWPEREAEIRILLSGPVHLNHLLIPSLLKNNNPAIIVNVTSGGGYIPQAFAPIYSACKAALHSYTMTLRDALSETAIKVVELVPPAVQTGLAGPGNKHGASIEEFCDSVFADLKTQHRTQIGFGPTKDIRVDISGKPQSELFVSSNSRFTISRYKPV